MLFRTPPSEKLPPKCEGMVINLHLPRLGKVVNGTPKKPRVVIEKSNPTIVFMTKKAANTFPARIFSRTTGMVVVYIRCWIATTINSTYSILCCQYFFVTRRTKAVTLFYLTLSHKGFSPRGAPPYFLRSKSASIHAALAFRPSYIVDP
jgi:hypothetical protein